MTEPQFSYRRIDQLKQLASDCNLTAEEARKYGKLSKTATWETLLRVHGVLQTVDSVLQSVDSVDKAVDTQLDTVLDKTLDTQLDTVETFDWTNDGSFPAYSFTPQNSTSFLAWVDLGQFLAFALASAGVFVLAMNLWPRINPLNLFPPVRINIQIGATK
jgi:hypothetical protein